MIEAKFENITKRYRKVCLILGIIGLIVPLFYLILNIFSNEPEPERSTVIINSGDTHVVSSFDAIDFMSILAGIVMFVAIVALVLAKCSKKICVQSLKCDDEYLYINDKKIPYDKIITTYDRKPTLIIVAEKTLNLVGQIMGCMVGYYSVNKIENFDEIYDYINKHMAKIKK